MFVQGEGIPDVVLVRIEEDETVRALLKAVGASGAAGTDADTVVVLLEDTDESLALDSDLQTAGIGHRSQVHVHRCRKVAISINFQGEQRSRTFSPAATVDRVHRWATGKQGFDLAKGDAADHALQVCNRAGRPGDDIHIGTLVTHPTCEICFDLVPKQRIEGARW